MISLAAVGAVAVLAAWILVNRPPTFYQRALQPRGLDRAATSKRFVSKAAELAHELRQPRGWEATFTQAEINAWLAEEFPRLARRFGSGSVLHEPRVVLGDGELLVGARRRGWMASRVIWMRLEPWVPERGRLAVRIRDVGVGALPLPASKVVDLIAELARRTELPFEWRRSEGDPVIVLRFGDRRGFDAIETIVLREGRLHLRGSSRQTIAGTAADASPPVILQARRTPSPRRPETAVSAPAGY